MYSGYLVAAIALSYVGAKTGSAKHKEILSVYNSVKPHGYAMRTSDPWCAAFWSAVQIMAGGNQKTIPMSANCPTIITDAKEMGIWQENESVTPKIGWGCLYDWQDGKNYAHYDNKGGADHIGIVYDVDDKYIYVVEGNKGSGIVGKRAVRKNGRYLRGFVKPNYGTLSRSSYKPDGYMIGKVPDNDIKFGDSGKKVKRIQKYLNYVLGYSLKVDGHCGTKTVNALLRFQKTYGLKCDGQFGDKSRQKARAMLIAYNAIAFAWASGTDKDKYYVQRGGKPNKNFREAWKKIYKNEKWNCGCHSFVKLVLRASGYPKAMPSLAWSKIFKWFNNHMKKIKVNFKMSQLESGDIRMHENSEGGHHIWIMAQIGKKMCRIEANQGGAKAKQRYAHVNKSTGGNTKHHKKDYLYRAR